MRVVAAACLLVLLLADVPRVSPRKIDSRPENPAEAEDEGYGFITTTISSLSSFLGLGKVSDDDADRKKEVEQPAENEADKADNDLASPKGGWSALDTPEEKTSASADSGAQPDPGLQADEAPKEESGKPDGGKPDKPANKPRDKDDPDSLLEKERSGGRPDNEDTREDREKDKEDKEDDKDKDKKEDKGDKEGDKEDKDREELEEKLNEISEKEDKILDKLDKEDKEDLERDPPRRRNSSGLVLVNRGPGGSGSPVILPRKPIGRGPGNSSVALMSDRQFQPYSPGVNALATHMRTCDNCLVTWDSFQCPMNDMAIELKKWITELEELLSFGCQLEGCDGSRKCCHRRDPVFERAVREMTDMARQMYNTFQSACSNCPRDGGWTEWCEWGSCSVTCGPGTRTRSRQCSNPTPKGGGRQCLGLARETLPCSNPSCCTHGNWADWSSWGPCDATCGSGMQERARICANPAPNHCGRTCPGPNNDVRPCDSRIPCCRDGQWSHWSSWSTCPITCGGGGVATRTRSCCNPAPDSCGRSCPGPSQDSRPCSAGQPCCTNGNWGFWGPWSQCSASCGSGTRDRRRRCDSPAPNHCGSTCPGSESDREICYTNIPCAPLCEDGNWGPWQPWSGCSVTCGSGTESRMRRCDNPAPNFCGQRCSGAASDTQPCHSGRDCCVDGNWGNWGPWSRCPVSCGTGMKERRRRCENPSPSHCGRPCPGPDSERFSCNAPPCIICIPRDGVWTSWSYWSSCSATCGRGTQERTRRCQPPNECGRPCVVGPARESQPCEEQSCCVNGNWGSWGPWSTPSATCGMVVRNRQRQCDRPRPNYCGSQCLGPDRETDNYDTNVPCIVCEDGNWGSWGPWGRPSVSCGMSMRERRRRCDNPPPNYCGRSCPGVNTDSDNYDTRVPCPPVCEDGNWGSWGPWGRPSVSCGMSVRERRRRCDSPPPNFCGRSCPGVNTDTDNYDTRVPCPPVCEDGNWGSWGPWGRPSSSCGMSVRERRRRCDNPPPNFCGRSCPGLNTDTDNYDTRVPCEPICVPLDGNWSLWSRWSPCSATCDGGTRSRYRSCTNPSPNQCGEDCRPRNADRETQPCNMGRCCVPRDGGWSPWSSWSPCPVTCGTGRVERSRSCSNPPPNECGSQCRGSSRDSQTCDRGRCCVPRDGGWSPWSSWSPCPVTCGTGRVERSRSCSNPPPNECGSQCRGSSRDSQTCDRGRCCVPRDGGWSPWSSWSPCPVTCGTGRVERSRSCSNPPPNECGSQCRGSSRDSQTCDRGSCCVFRTWENWGPWSQPGVTCGTASRERRRRCALPLGGVDCGQPCPGPDSERESYDTGVPCIVCIDGNWGSWFPWGSCSHTCGGGTQDRQRSCNNPRPNSCGRECMGPAKDMRRCNEHSCCIPENGNWGSWTPWSSCSASCGSGMRERSRECNNPRRRCGGRDCPGPRRETDVCSGGDCCVNGNWGNWGPWGRPTVTCGTYLSERRRRCDRPTPNFCGRDCPGSAVDTQVSDTGIPCRVCIDGNWGSWEPWSMCTVTCGMGPRERRRRCNDPSPNECGRTCPGLAFETGLQRCGPELEVGNWSPWGPWGSCSRSCGRGQQTRRRRCDVGRCGSRCPGSDSDTQGCDEGPCCVPREWTPWSPWSACDASCGRGRRTRQRTCRSVGYGDDCGSRCPGRGEEVDSCRGLPPCEPPWGPWGGCSATCEGFGVRERRRISTGRFDELVGRQTETERCQVFTPPCPQPAEWTRWNEWCPCDCKKGVRARRRTCEQRGPSFGRGSPVDISNCGGPAREEDYCDVRQACPPCVEDCTGRLDGDYPACTSCSDYLKCSNGRAGMLSCGGNGNEYDAFIRKCVPPPSPSCTLVDCVTSCARLADGTYPSCSGCGFYIRCSNGREGQLSCPSGQEFNAHSGQCVSGRSPTCVRAIRRSLEFMYRDAPADSYFPADKLSDEERKALYLELRKKVGVAAKFNRTDEDFLAREEERKKEEEEAKNKAEEEKKKAEEEKKKAEEEEKKAEEEKKEEARNEIEEEEEDEKNKKAGSVVIEEEEEGGAGSKAEEKKKAHKLDNTTKFKGGKFVCQKDCTNVKMGRFQSCRGCHYFLVCTKHGVPRHVKCPRHKSWDDIKKKCRRHSDTCKDENTTTP